MTTSVPDPAPILELIEAFRRSKVMFTATGLGLFDRLNGASAAAPALAAELSLSEDALSRLLDACAGQGLLVRSGGEYTNTPLATAYLTASSPHTLAGYVNYSNQVLFRLWANLEDAVRDGSHRWNQTFGLEGPLFSAFFKTDESMRTFVLGMHGYGMIASPRVVRAFDLSRFAHLADLGGATGHLVMAACEAYPAMRATLFDLERVANYAREFIGQSPHRERIEIAAGDFFQDPLPPADLYAVGRILHDWTEAKVKRLLARIVNALPEGGGLLIAEALIEEDRTGPVSAQLQSLNMLCCTEGKERTLSEYTALLTGAGFRTVEGRRTGAPVDAILAIK
ncbi:MAG: homocysteine methyltransferase [Acidobacteria bacterium]|nr:homocysteine methyltransferase [Acidobacteriota bacterium]